MKGDIRNREFIYNVFNKEKFVIVINFITEAHRDNSILISELFLKTNVLGNQVLIDACLKFKVKIFHQISIDEDYVIYL